MSATTPPPVTGLTARYYGPSGGAQQRNYWVQALYPDGSRSLFAGPVTLNNTPAALGGGSNPQSGIANVGTGPFVAIGWNPAPGAVAYDLICTPTNAYPSGQGSFGVVTGLTANAYADVSQGAPGTSAYLTYAPLNRTYLNVAFARYDFAVDGGAVSSIVPAVSDVIPINAVVLGGQVKVITGFVGATATIAIGVSGVSNTLLLGATAVATYAAQAVINLAATFAAAAKVTAAGQINVTIAVVPLTAGSMEIFVLYVVPTA